MAPAKRARLGSALSEALTSTHVVRAKLWNRDRRVIYSDDPKLVGHRFNVDDDLEAALHGTAGADVSDLKQAEDARDRRFGQLIEVYVPLRFRGAARPAGAFEVYLPYRSVAARIQAKARHTVLLTLGGLVMLWLALFRLVAGASRRLRRQAADNAHQALHDALTGLPNRTHYQRAVEQAIAAAHGHGVAVLLLDIDRFKDINDTLGHHIGDRLLVDVGPRLACALGAEATVARLGGDEFAVMLPAVRDADEAVAVARRALEALALPFEIAEATLHAEASLGVALHPDHGGDVATLLQRADVAMYTAKRGRTGVELYRSCADPYSTDRLLLLGELRGAIDRGELVLHYQPKVELPSGRPVGAEALVRWDHPRRGLLPPSEFVALAEHTGLIRPLTLWVLDEALAQCRRWRDEGLDLQVAVNLSAASLVDGSLPNDVARAIARSGLPPSALALEITESLVMTDPARAGEVLGLLRSMRVDLAIDDYGTGQASLAYLCGVPACELKIDRAFVAGLATDATSAAIVRSTIELGHSLGLCVVAEGVEDELVYRRLAQWGCDLAQGFHMARPLGAEEATAWLRSELATPRLRLAA